jgi:acylphosphatase
MEVYKFIVHGKVQGVFYRKFVSQNAMKKGFEGYIKNLDNGDVEAVAVIYDDKELEEFREILKKGSPLSRVDSIDEYILEEDDLIYDGFEIRS